MIGECGVQLLKLVCPTAACNKSINDVSISSRAANKKRKEEEVKKPSLATCITYLCACSFVATPVPAVAPPVVPAIAIRPALLSAFSYVPAVSDDSDDFEVFYFIKKSMIFCSVVFLLLTFL